MINISYDNWNKICNAYKDVKVGTRKSYLQWYSLSNQGLLSYLSSQEFFNKYIKTGYVFTDSNVLCSMNHYLQKGDGTFRDAQLVSPIFYLIIQTICYEIYQRGEFTSRSSSIYYSGDFEKLDLHYVKTYDSFYKHVNYSSEIYPYYIKLDISDFFRSINLDTLFHEITEYCINDTFTENELFIFKEIFLYCGQGKFPVLENSTGLSFLASYIYLNDCDKHLSTFLKNKEKIIDYELVRYVDDLYVFINIEDDINIEVIASDIINQYLTILDKKNLRLNTSKIVYGNTKNINESLKQSLYDEVVNGEIFELHKESFEMLKKFLDELSDFVKEKKVVISDEYDKILEKNFRIEGSDVSSRELFLKSIYNCPEIVNDSDVVSYMKTLNRLQNYRYDTKMLITLILKTENGELIKAFLNELFKKSRDFEWSKTDIYAALIYLLNRNFKNTELLGYIKSENHELYGYISNYCLDTIKFVEMKKINIFEKLGIRKNTMKLFLLYKIEVSRNNHLQAFAYYKTYFDAVTAEIDFFINSERRKVNYRGFYKDSQLKDFYYNNKKLENTIIPELFILLNFPY